MDIGKQWRHIIDSVQDGIIIVDEKGCFVAANQTAQWITGYTEEELKGQSCRILNCTGCKIIGKGKGKNWCGLFSQGLIREKKCLITNRQNRTIPIIKSATVLFDDKKEIIGAVETLKDISENINYKNELASIKRMYHIDDGFHGIVGRTPVMQSLYELIESVASQDTPVMILGESGTGKEMVAKALHETGERASKPFVKVNCAALSEHILESELFGHVKGAYTGADSDRVGRFEAAHKGTIFLDEIGDIPLSVQVKLLRVLEEKMIQRVGANKSIQIDVRIITATNKNLEQLIKDGLFREDLFFRINVFPLTCPPLRHRKDDITLIIQHFINFHAEKTGKNILGITPEAMRLMVAYPWPGNIRELRNSIEYAFVLAREKSIGPEHLPEKIISHTSGETGSLKYLASKDTVFNDPTFEDTIKLGLSEKEKLLDALRQTDGNQSRAAKILGVSRITVWKRIKKYGIQLK
ncbi:sigma-54 interaction domain-containing protein [Desulfobacula phenolica]|uniref:PAS domain S-box-containing protein n=1 Tax=Desulfobacula phenolica TaxID=90732 RepID=A0A1H2GHA8_9BACT|nr:sigma 54-interacting transcriptional regulator [Desulfobacula phenolica]SDU18997.1 PAS domain S-box-containing protein [Desulfobacula phenolica]